MGQITNPITKGITVLPVDQQSGPGAAAGSTSNNALLLGQNAGLNSSANDLIVLGSQSGKGGISGAFLSGTIVIGAFSAEALVTHTVVATNPQANIIIGDQSLQATTTIDSTIAIGQQIYQNVTGSITGNVLLGNGIGSGVTGGFSIQQSVCIGQNAGGSPATNEVQLVCIGYNALSTNTVGSGGGDVFIGALVGQVAGASGTGFAHNVVIGSQADVNANATANVVIGYQAKASQNTGGVGGSNIAIGVATQAGTTSDGVGGNIVIGGNASIPLSTTTGQNVIIGQNAGVAFVGTTPALNKTLVIEINASGGGSQKCLIFGSFSAGNLVLGNSISGTSQDTGGAGATNIVKLINGTIGAAAPVGGGYFYVTGGVLHWVDSAGNDSQLSEGAGQLAANALHAYTNNAAAAVGTLTNAPAAGNPTKWIPINDNGTIRNIPAW
jgi:hypothetical protein